MPESWKPLAGLDLDCFACGRDNRHGLQMRFESNGEKLRSQVLVKPQFRGWSKLVHGGVISTLLDETMSWTAISLMKRFILTKGMSVSFKRPIYIGTELTVTGYIKEHIDERRVMVAAEICDDNKKICAMSEGEFVLFSREQFRRLNLMPDEDLEVMAAAFSK